MNIINYDNYIESKKLFEIQDEPADNVYLHGLKKLIEETANGYDYVSYTTYLKLTLFNAAVLERDNDDNYIYNYEYKKNEDVIDNIHFNYNNMDNVKLKIIIGGVEQDYDQNFNFITMAAQYHSLVFKFIFNVLPQVGDDLTLNYTSYLFNTTDRNLLARSNIKTKKHIFSNGMCCLINKQDSSVENVNVPNILENIPLTEINLTKYKEMYNEFILKFNNDIIQNVSNN